MLMYASTTHEFKRVCLLFTLFKRCKKSFCILQILLQVLPSKTEEVMQIEQMRISNKWAQAQINIKEWCPARA